MESTIALLRIAARLVAASAALLLREGEDAPLAAWGCDDTAARALLRLRADEPAGTPSMFQSLPLRLADDSVAELVLVAAEPLNEAVERLAREIGVSCDPRGSRGPAVAARLVESIEQLAEAMAIMHVGETTDESPRFVHVNAAFSRAFGYEAPDLAGATTDVLFGPRTDVARVDWLRHRLVQNQDARAVLVLYTRDATPLWTEASHAPIALGGGERGYFVATYRDVTSRKQFEDALGAEKRKLQTTLAAIADAVVTVLPDGRVDFINGAAQRLLGIDLVDAYGAAIRDVVRLVDADGKPLDLVAAAGIGDDAACRGEGQLRAKGGAIEVAYTASRIDAEGNAVVVLRDVTAEHRLALKLSFEASHDPLTGLPNRRAFLERLETAVTNAREQRAHHAVAFLDLDRFKIVNDRFGHAAGDRMLREIARVMGRVVRGGDVLARIGGDEFALLLSDCRIDDARRVVEKMRKAVDAYRIEHHGEVLGVGVSIGLAPIESETVAASEALALADAACYQAKAAGRNVVAG